MIVDDARRLRLAQAIVWLVWSWVMPVAAAADDAGPRFDYLLNCAGCHRADATGSSEVPALTEMASFLATPQGRTYLVRVPGVAQAPLSDERLAALLNWTLVEFGGADRFTAYSAAEVAALRAEPLRDPRRERERLKSGQAH